MIQLEVPFAVNLRPEACEFLSVEDLFKAAKCAALGTYLSLTVSASLRWYWRYMFSADSTHLGFLFRVSSLTRGTEVAPRRSQR